MQLVHRGNHPGKSSIMFLPMIDMDPTDLTCIYSTLSYVVDHAERHNSTPILTFDQPLYFKALKIALSEPEGSSIGKIVLIMGGLHKKMSFVGTFGYLMGNSGLKELCETIYASNTVDHILSGKAISRAIRAHILIDSALNGLLLSKALDQPLFEDASNDATHDATNVAGICLDDAPESLAAVLQHDYQRMMAGRDPLQNDNPSQKVQELLNKEIESLATSRTAKLWLQYMTMVNILKKFIRAERTGNFQLHLEATHEMLPYFAAAGHNSYLKSSHLYLQKMCQIEKEHCDVYHHFTKGLHVVEAIDSGLDCQLT